MSKDKSADFYQEIQKSKKWDEFREYFYKTHCVHHMGSLIRHVAEAQLEKFLDFPFSFQQGVLLEFLREHGIEIDIEMHHPFDHVKNYRFSMRGGVPAIDYFEVSDYNLGIQEAILKAFNL